MPFSFDLPDSKHANVKALKDKINRGSNTTPVPVMRKASKVGGNDLLKTVNSIKALVAGSLGKYADSYLCIRDEKELEAYIDKCIEDGVCAIDTETTSLDPITTTIAGFSIYSPSQKAAYIPINHHSYMTLTKLENQISEQFCKQQLQRLEDNGVKIIMFNAKFDIRVIKHTLGVKLTAYYDAYVAAMLLNENEPDANLKALHNKYCLDGKGDAFRFNDLFETVTFIYIPIKTGYLYAARDAEITYELYKYQEPYLTKGTEENYECELEQVADIFWNLEMPLVDVNVALEDTGIYFDFDLDEKFSEKYNRILKEREAKFHEILSQYENEINSYRRVTGVNCKLSDPISIGSPQQIAILLYDILKLTSCEKGKPRGTGENAIKDMDHPVAKAILDYRETQKLISTYVDKLPNDVNPKTHRIHASFNPVGTVTGRYSSSNPNLQNIPSRGEGKEIRNLFVASPGYVMISSDYSAQEPRLITHLSMDPKMVQAYKEGKDLYCVVASLAFNKPYEECMEHWPDGSLNPEGKKLRGQAKSIVLGTMYGRGITSIAEQLGTTRPKAQQIYDKVMEAFPDLKEFMHECRDMAFELGYVTTVWGRKRRLPGIQLPKYEFSRLDGHVGEDFNPLDFDNDTYDNEYIDPEIIQYYTKKLNSCWGPKKFEIIEEAKGEGILIKDNGGIIAECERQCVNARVQGSAADLTKRAMIMAYNDDILRECGFRMLIPVHDEIIGEAPYEHAKRAGERLSEIMIRAADGLAVPFLCDAEYSVQWYGKALEDSDIEDLKNGVKVASDFY